MAIKHVEGDFGAEHFPESFGFHGSARGANPPFAADHPTHNSGGGASVEGENRFASGGHLHPHGHKVVEVHHNRHDGSVVHRHEHGGFSVHHKDGHVTHHHHDGKEVHHLAHGGLEHMHDSSEYAHRGMGEEDGEHFARGGGARIPPMQHIAAPHISMPHAATVRRIRAEPVNRPPRNPAHTTTPRNEMSGGEMPYGVEPSAEPDDAGSDQGIPQLRHGGRARGR